MHAEEILRTASALAEHLRRSGVAHLPAAQTNGVQRWVDRFEAGEQGAREPEASPAVAKPSTQAIASSASRPRSRPVPAVKSDRKHYETSPLSLVDRQRELGVLADEVAGCTRCEVLASRRKQTVFGVGNPEARFLFVGEAPGADEDRLGEPFVGKAGQLLTKMIQACTLSREEVYIMNTIKCRPPGNRNPEPEEMQNCRGFFDRQLELIQPEYIVCLGAISMQAMLATKLSVGRMRGKLHEYRGSKVLVTYHPAYLLRNPDAKKAAWEDLQLMLRDAGIQVGR
ncbi:MAG: uracil-DNA glycosylase [Planctomycetota bacterium]